MIEECRRCQVDREVARPEQQCQACSKRRRIDRFGPWFRDWMDVMTDLYDRMQAGWQVHNDDLDLEEWRALARIGQYYRLREAGLIGSKR